MIKMFKPTARIWFALVAVLAFSEPARAQYVISNTWKIATGVRTYVTSGNTERGIAYNPFTGHVLLVSRAGSLRVVILDGADGTELGFLDVNGISGGTFALSVIAVGDDGAIYAANLSTSTTAPNFKVYRWADESAAPVNIYSGDPANGLAGAGPRWGENLDVRGSGANTEIVAANNTASPALPLAAIIKPTDETLTTWTATTLSNITGIAAQDMAKGISFGTNNTFFAKNSGQSQLRLISYDLTTGTGSVIATRTINAATVGIAFDTETGLLSAVQTANNTNNANHNLLVYDAAPGGTLPLVGSISFSTNAFGTNTANPNLVGESDIVNSNIVAVDTQNGIVAAKILYVPEPKIVANPPDRTVVQGGYTSMSADATGVPPLRYQWFHNGNPVANETNRILNFTNVVLTQAGDYTVAVSNDFGGVVSGPGKLTVDPTVLSAAMTLLWQLSPGSRPYINTDSSQRGLAYNPATHHVLMVSRTGSNGIHVLDADTGAHLHSLNTDPTIVTNGTFFLNMVDVTEDGVVYAGNLTQDGNFKLYQWLDDSAITVPTVAWQGFPGPNDVVRWGDALDVSGTAVNPRVVLTSRNSNYVSVLNIIFGGSRYVQLTDVPAGEIGLGVAIAEDTGTAFRFWAKSVADPQFPARSALRQFEVTDDGTTLSYVGIVASNTNYPNMGPLGADPANKLLAGVSTETPDNVRLLDTIAAASGFISTVDTEFFPTDNANGNGTGNVAFGPNRIYALDSNNGLMAFSYNYTRPECGLPPTLSITRSGADVVVSWSGSGYRLERATEFANPESATSWNHLSSSSPVTVQATGEKMFLRLICP